MRFLFLLSFLFITAGNIFPQTLSDADSENSNDYRGPYKLLQLFSPMSYRYYPSVHISYDGNTVLGQNLSSIRIFRKGSDGLYERVEFIISGEMFDMRWSEFTSASMSLDGNTIIATEIQPDGSLSSFVRIILYRKNAEDDYMKLFDSEVQYPLGGPLSAMFASSNGNLVMVNMPYKVLEDFPDSEIERFFEEDDNRNDYFGGYGVFGEEIFTLVFDENIGKFTRKQVLERTPYLLLSLESIHENLQFSAIHPDGKFIKTYNKKRETVWKRQKNNTYKETPDYQKDRDYLDYIEKKDTNYEKIFSNYSTNAKERYTATDYQVDVLAISPRLREDFVNTLGEPRTRYIPGKIMDIWERGKDGSYKKIQTIDNGEPIEEIVISGDGKTIISASENILKAWVRVE